MSFMRYAFRAINSISKLHLNSPRVKGFIGETFVNNALKDEELKIHNLSLRMNNRSAQIDHVVINDKGILVLETKNYSGLIKGFAKQKYWVQHVNK